MEDPVQKPVNPADQVAPAVSSVRREIETVAAPNYDIQHSEQEPNIPTEVKEAGVEATALEPNLTREHFDVGIRHSPEAVKPSLETTGAVKLPMTHAEAVSATRGKIDDSRTWQGVLIEKIYKVRQMLGLGGLKKVTV